MRVLLSNKKLKVGICLSLLLFLLFTLQFSSLPPVWAQGGDEDGGETGYTEQPGDSANNNGELVNLPNDGSQLEDPSLDEEALANIHEEVQSLTQNTITPTLTLNTGHESYYNEQTGEWIDDPTVTTYSKDDNLVQTAEEQQYYQDKLKGVDPTKLTFRSGFTIEPEAGITPAVFEQLTSTLQDSTTNDSYYLIQFSYPFPIEARQRLETTGVVFYDNVGQTGFYAKVPPEAIETLQALVNEGLVLHMGEIPLEAKVESDLIAAAATSSSQEYAVTVLTFVTPTPTQLQELKSLMTIDQRSDDPIHITEGIAPVSSIQPLAELDYVRWVEKQPVNELHNLDGNMGIGGDIVRQTGQDGTGVNVMVVDTGIARSGSTYHPDLPSNRILDQWDYQFDDNIASDFNSHGTHVAGTVGGRYNSSDSNSNRSHQGMAPDADFYIYKLCCGTGQFASSWFQLAMQRGTSGGRTTHISQNSWGASSVFGTYNTNSEIADRAVRGEYNGQRVNMVIASGNNDDLTSAPGTGKNVITVGSVKDGNYPNQNLPGTSLPCPADNWPPGEQVCYSNQGPIDTDGDSRSRVKPDVVAPGAMINSAAPWYLYTDNRYYQFKHGTSMATPHVSGAIAQILDYYSSSNPWLWSWPETVKALLLATTVDVGGNTNLYGHGLVNPFHAMYSQSGISSANFWANTIASGETKDFTFTVPSGYQELRVVLTWTDPAGSTELSHDLDILSVIDPSGTSRGASQSWDDTVEYVKIPAGYSAGTWTVRVRAFSLTSNQRFGLAVHRVLADANLSVDPSVEYIPSSDSSVAPDDHFYLHQYIPNSGFAAGGAYTRLNIPTGFTVKGVRVYTADGHSHWYAASEIYHPSGSSYWRVATGEVISGYTRHVRWFIQADSSLTEGVYNFYTIPYWREEGTLQSGIQKTSTVSVGIPDPAPSGPPLDIYFLVDLSNSFIDDLPKFKSEAPAIVDTLKASNSNIRFGLGRFEDYPISPFGSATYRDKAYERVVDLTFNDSTVKSAIAGLSTRFGGDGPESQLAALYQSATGAGQNLSSVGYPGASIPAGQQANFRSEAEKIIILWTDASFHQPGDPGSIPYPSPSFAQTTTAINALGNAFVYGIFSGGAGATATSLTQSRPNSPEQSLESAELSIQSGSSDLTRIVADTGAFAGDDGVDCDGDGDIDISRGQPLVCGVGSSGQGIGQAIISLVRAKRGPALTFVPVIIK
ncbi:MAG: S8 family serine peptidase [Anaerolineae bacterium]|nr:S8 family serine peptidase [Anaerolineae bacterium]